MKIGDDVSVDIYGGEDRPLGVSIKSDESYLVSENGNIFDVDSAGKLKGSEGRTVMPATVEAIFQSAIDLVEANKAGLES
jgi:hypothetical protein